MKRQINRFTGDSAYSLHLARRRLKSKGNELERLRKIARFEYENAEAQRIAKDRELNFVKSLLQYYYMPDHEDSERLSDVNYLFDNKHEYFAKVNSLDFKSINICVVEKIWNFDRCYAHVDLNCFYAAVEALENPQFKDKPIGIIVKDMLITCNYLARAHGVRIGHTTSEAKALSPTIHFFPSRMWKYEEMSRKFFAECGKIDPEFISMGIDELSMDISHIVCHKSTKSLVAFADELCDRVRNATDGLNCCIGVATTRLLAKVCSNLRKPDGNYFLPPKYSIPFLCVAPPKKLCGIGFATNRYLTHLNVKNCIEAVFEAAKIRKVNGPVQFVNLIETLCGLYYAKRQQVQKSAGAIRSFTATDSLYTILSNLEHEAMRLGERAQHHNIKSRLLIVRLGFADFRSQQRKAQLYDCSTEHIFRQATSLIISILHSLNYLEKQEFSIYRKYLDDPEAIKNITLKCKLRKVALRLPPVSTTRIN